MFRIKICGVTSPADARLAVDAGADAVGLNFYPRSTRYVAPESAAQIVAEIEGRALAVGVFVNETASAIQTIAEMARLGAVQLHGDEPPELLAELGGIPIVRARRMSSEGVATIADDLAACRQAGRLPDALLVDSPASPGQYGGTGDTFAWSDLATNKARLGSVPLILAGGLRAENVAQAIVAVRPFGVDVASGVEGSPGRKDPELVSRFVAAARAALGLN